MKTPVTYTPEIAATICEQLASGKSLRAICRQAGMPTETAVRQWVIDDAHGFSSHYARARDKGLDSLADEIIEISNTPVEGVIVTDKPTGQEVSRRDMIEHRRLQVDARKWYLSKLAPKRYGDLQRIEHSGSVDMASTILQARKRAAESNIDDLL